MAKIKRAPDPAAPPPSSVLQWTRDLLTAKTQQKFFKSRQDEVTKRLKAYVQDEGYTDDQGHVWLDLPDEVEGVKKLQMQRKVSQSLREEKAEEILKAKGIYDRCTTTVTVIDQDEIMAAHFRGELTEDDIDAMFPKTVNFALMTPKG